MKIIETNNFIKQAYLNDQTLPGFLPSRGKPNNSPQILFNDHGEETEDDIVEKWNKKQKGIKKHKIYQRGVDVPIVDEDFSLPLIPV